MSAMTAQAGSRVRSNDPLYGLVLDWLIDEAALLDGRRYEEWLACLAPTLRYVMPIRRTVLNGETTELADGYAHFDESYGSIEVRVKRLGFPSAWAEDPPSRIRRFVSNLRVHHTGDDEIAADSYLLLLRSRGDAPAFEIFSGERRDVFVPSADDPDRLLLASRTIIPDQSRLGLMNLSFFV